MPGLSGAAMNVDGPTKSVKIWGGATKFGWPILNAKTEAFNFIRGAVRHSCLDLAKNRMMFRDLLLSGRS